MGEDGIAGYELGYGVEKGMTNTKKVREKI